MNPAMVFLRGGGLGDFILTLPLIQLAHQKNHRVYLYARSSYLKLLGEEWDWLKIRDLDQLSGVAPNEAKDNVVISFWRDVGWSKEMMDAGALNSVMLDPRPLEGPSFLNQASMNLGWSLPENFRLQPFLGERWNQQNQTLWIHPGSGGNEKNLPLKSFIFRAHQWLETASNQRVIFSFGEADEPLWQKFTLDEISRHPRVSITRPASVYDFKKQMGKHAVKFLGNDSGPGHLAANLGIPVEIYFLSTSESVWKPTGPNVITHN